MRSLAVAVGMTTPTDHHGELEPSDQDFHCPVCSFGPQTAAETLVHIVTNHEIEA